MKKSLKIFYTRQLHKIIVIQSDISFKEDPDKSPHRIIEYAKPTREDTGSPHCDGLIDSGLNLAHFNKNSMTYELWSGTLL